MTYNLVSLPRNDNEIGGWKRGGVGGWGGGEGKEKTAQLKRNRGISSRKCHLSCCVTSVSLSRLWRNRDRWERSSLSDCGAPPVHAATAAAAAAAAASLEGLNLRVSPQMNCTQRNVRFKLWLILRTHQLMNLPN